MRIGTIDIPNAVILAPMEDVTDIPFRLVCKRMGADLMFTEFVNSEGLVRKSGKTHKKMEFLEEERPFGIQIYGGTDASMEGAAGIASSLSPDLIDINCGCWVKNIAGHGAGAGLLRDLPRMRRIIEGVVRSTPLPVTVKTRLGWDEGSIMIVEVAKMVEDAGAKAITIHCRTRSQGHSGTPDYRLVPEVKRVVSIPVIVNGGIDSPAAAGEVFASTGCDGVMVARGAVNNPWIFREIKAFLTDGTLIPPPGALERFDVLLEHLDLSVKYKGERTGVLEFRKHYSGYLRELPGIAKIRHELMTYTEHPPLVEHLLLLRERFAGSGADAIPALATQGI
jgi:tRNA-dihydrouridine synthase B